MGTKPWAIGLIVLVTLLISVAQVLYKIGAGYLTPSVAGVLSNSYFLAGLGIYVLGGILLILSFRGGEVSVLYPILAVTYIWVSIISFFYLGESMNASKIGGILFVFLGTSLIGYRPRRKNGS